MSSIPPIRVAIVTGGHPFDVPSFAAVFRAMPDVDAYVQHLEDFTSDVAGRARGYEVVVFYNMTKLKPTDQLAWYEGKTFTALEALGERTQGILVLHHALLAFPEWELWSQIVGMRKRRIESYHMGQEVFVHVADPTHPVTSGLSDWTITDETYLMGPAEPADGNHLLLTTDNPTSTPTLAWARTFRNSRVLCYQSGHDARAFEDASFRRFVHQGIRWLAGR